MSGSEMFSLWKNSHTLSLLLIAVVFSGMLFSCKGIILQTGSTAKTLADIESYIEEHPENALKAIEAIDTNALRGRRIKAKYALLRSIAFYKNNIDTIDTSRITPALEYYWHHGSKAERMKMEYILGLIKYNQADYSEAVVSFADAEELARSIHDSLYMSLSLMGKSNTYYRSYFNNEMSNERKALAIFNSAGIKDYSEIARYRMGIALQHIGQYDSAAVIYDSMLPIFKSQCDTALVEDCLKNYSLLSLSKNRLEPEKAIEMLKSAVKDYKGTLDVWQYGELAYAYALTGDKNEADLIMRQLNGCKEAYYWQYKVIKAEKRDSEVNVLLERAAYDQDSVVAEIFKESPIMALGNNYRKKAEISRQKSIKSIIWLHLSVLVAILAVWLSFNYRSKLKEERDQLLSIAEETGREGEIMQNKMVLSQRKREQFSHFRDMCVKYSRLESEDARQTFIRKQIMPVLEGFKANSGKHSEFERYIDESTDGVMTHLREDMKKFSEQDFIFLSYIIINLDTSTIARLMNLTKENVRTKKFRLVRKVVEMDSVYKELYQRIFII